MDALLGQPALRVVVDLCLIGVFGGFYIVPLYALIQSRTRAEPRVARGRGQQHPERAFMVAAAGLAIALLKAGFSVPRSSSPPR